MSSSVRMHRHSWPGGRPKRCARGTRCSRWPVTWTAIRPARAACGRPRRGPVRCRCPGGPGRRYSPTDIRAALIATLRDPQTASWQGGTSGRRAFLAYWLTVDSIWLTGGLLTGACGGPVLDGIRAASARAPHPCRVALAPHPLWQRSTELDDGRTGSVLGRWSPSQTSATATSRRRRCSTAVTVGTVPAA